MLNKLTLDNMCESLDTYYLYAIKNPKLNTKKFKAYGIKEHIVKYELSKDGKMFKLTKCSEHKKFPNTISIPDYVPDLNGDLPLPNEDKKSKMEHLSFYKTLEEAEIDKLSRLYKFHIELLAIMEQEDALDKYKKSATNALKQIGNINYQDRLNDLYNQNPELLF